MTWMPQPQNADGVPHFTYYDQTMLLSFVWDGISLEIDVCEGGYGEPVIDTIPIPHGYLSMARNPGRWLAQFQVLCQIYVKEKAHEGARAVTDPDRDLRARVPGREGPETT